ncbi:MAG: UMP kinase [SAR202 cluster bacterium]|nr:UMP kinase [SAR202 cluster bacterium]
MQSDPSKFKRILLKLSGESFKGDKGFGIDPNSVGFMAGEIKTLADMGIEIGVVVGGGNIWRGSEAAAKGMDRATADYAGMLATVINALALQDSLENQFNVLTRTQTAIDIQQVAEPYIRRKAMRHLEKGRVVIFAAGIGNPYVTTDTAAALKAIEIEAQILIMAKHEVDGVYSSDPNLDSNATKYEFLTYRDVIDKRLEVMDTTAISLCMDNEVPIKVFNMFEAGNLKRLINGAQIGSTVASNNQ